MLDQLDRRILAGLKIMDHVTGDVLSGAARPVSKHLKFAPTASGFFAITYAPGFAAYSRSFRDVPAVPSASFDVLIDVAGPNFLPVTMSVELPRNGDATAVSNRVDSPIEISLASSASRRPVAGWTQVYVTVVDQNDTPLRGVLVQVLEDGTDAELGWGLTGLNGVAFIPLTGVALLKDGPDDGDDDTVDLVTADSRMRLRTTVQDGLPWPADTTKLRAGGSGTRRRTSARRNTLKAGQTLRLQHTQNIGS